MNSTQSQSLRISSRMFPLIISSLLVVASPALTSAQGSHGPGYEAGYKSCLCQLGEAPPAGSSDSDYFKDFVSGCSAGGTALKKRGGDPRKLPECPSYVPPGVSIQPSRTDPSNTNSREGRQAAERQCWGSGHLRIAGLTAPSPIDAIDQTYVDVLPAYKATGEVERILVTYIAGVLPKPIPGSGQLRIDWDQGFFAPSSTDLVVTQYGPKNVEVTYGSSQRDHKIILSVPQGAGKRTIAFVQESSYSGFLVRCRFSVDMVVAPSSNAGGPTGTFLVSTVKRGDPISFRGTRFPPNSPIKVTFDDHWIPRPPRGEACSDANGAVALGFDVPEFAAAGTHVVMLSADASAAAQSARTSSTRTSSATQPSALWLMLTVVDTPPSRPSDSPSSPNDPPGHTPGSTGAGVTITPDPAIAAPGQTMSLAWSGFTGLSRGALTVDGTRVWNSYLQKNPFTFSLPAGLTPGRHTLTLSDTEGHRASATLTISGSSPSTPPSRPGGMPNPPSGGSTGGKAVDVTITPDPAVVVSGQDMAVAWNGFTDLSRGTLTLDGSRIWNGYLQRNPFTFSLPTGLTVGQHTLNLTDTEGHQASAKLTVGASVSPTRPSPQSPPPVMGSGSGTTTTRISITPDPAVVVSGQNVSLAWTGFTDLSRGTLTLDGQRIWNSYLQRNPFTFSLPAGLAPGQHVLTLVNTEGHQASAALTVARSGQSTAATSSDSARSATASTPSRAERLRWLGLSLTSVTSEAAQALGMPTLRGFTVTGVSAGRAADAGVETGDVITHVADQAVGSKVELDGAIRQLSKGARIPVRVVRDGRRMVLTVPGAGELPMKRQGDVPASRPGDVPIKKAGDVEMNKSGDVPMSKTGDVPMRRPGDVSVSRSGDVPMNKAGDVPMKRQGDVTMPRSGDVPMSKSGDVPMRKYGDVVVPKSGEVAMSKTGEDVKIPKRGDVTVPTQGDVPAPRTSSVPRREPAPEDRGRTGSPEKGSTRDAGSSGHVSLTGSFSRLLSGGRTVETWTFKPNGTYQYALGTPGVASHSAAGTFRIRGDMVVLTQTTEATAASSGRRDVAGSRMGSSVQQLKFQVSGKGAQQHLILDGKEYFRALD